MEKKILYLILLITIITFTSCSSDDMSSTSVINIDKVDQTQFDKWLNVNYVQPYNVEFKYRYEYNESDPDYYTVPAKYDECVEMAHLIKYLCLESYDEVAGVNFTRANFPKLIYNIGEFEYRNNGTFILGTAEGGKKILLTGVNHLDEVKNSPEYMNEYYFKTIHHEFTHILNQTKDYSTDFRQITGSGYVADKWSTETYSVGYLQRGFISAYSQHSHGEDFAEMLSIYVCNSQAQWDAWMNEAGPDGASLIQEKLDIVKDYMKSSWNIDMDELRAAIQRRQADVSAGKIILTDLTVK